MIKPIFKNGIIVKFKIDNFLKPNEINNYNEVIDKLSLLGYKFSHYYNNIPFFFKGTNCKSLGDLINIYKISFLPRQNCIPYQEKKHIELIPQIIDKPIKKIQKDYTNKFYDLREKYLSTNDKKYIDEQIHLGIQKAHLDYQIANHVFKETSQFYMLPETAQIYHQTISELSCPGEQLAITKDYGLSTSSIIVYITQCINHVLHGHGGIYWNHKYQILNSKGRALIVGKRIKPYPKLKQSYLGSNKKYDIPEGYRLATIQDYLDYLNSYYNKLSTITGDKYPKCKFTISDTHIVHFIVPSLVYYIFI